MDPPGHSADSAAVHPGQNGITAEPRMHRAACSFCPSRKGRLFPLCGVGEKDRGEVKRRRGGRQENQITGPEVDRTRIDERGSRTEAPVFATASASRSSRRKICSWPPVSGNPHLRAWFILPGVVRTASVTGSSPGAEEARGATDNHGYRVPSGGPSTRPITLAAATSLPRPTTHDYVPARTLAAHRFPD
ncbi:hypothetical protein HPB52_021414 [Rhipicephalus sanguineus]|uniref:Uncharacterized protein n=1 Tax=Rhipicephalus sanguineus TaxID=34632 RepID=A0A9D4SPF7_RHISA|nr:hypothetical protein HPB52_021414 [Rhipicephalus sanguineus]